MSSCIFCKIVTGELPGEILYEDEHVIAFMDIMPVSKGHVLLIPKTHRRMYTTSRLTRRRICSQLHRKSLLPSRIRSNLQDLTLSKITVQQQVKQCSTSTYILSQDMMKQMVIVQHGTKRQKSFQVSEFNNSLGKLKTIFNKHVPYISSSLGLN